MTIRLRELEDMLRHAGRYGGFYYLPHCKLTNQCFGWGKADRARNGDWLPVPEMRVGRIVDVPRKHGMSRMIGIDWAKGHHPEDQQKVDLTEHGEEALGHGASTVAFDGLVGTPIDWQGIRKVVDEKCVGVTGDAALRISVELVPVMNERTGRPVDVAADESVEFRVPEENQKGEA